MATTRVFGKLETASKVETISADRTLTASDSGKVFILDAAAGKTITLPAVSISGWNAKFIVGANFATSNFIVASAEGDNINGVISDMGATETGVLAEGEDKINFIASAETIGDWVEFIADSGNSQWIVTGVCGANGGITATDPS
jgi:hypothetical protein